MQRFMKEAGANVRSPRTAERSSVPGHSAVGEQSAALRRSA